jgi:DNA-binding CsgD family transcriptional regulator
MATRLPGPGFANLNRHMAARPDPAQAILAWCDALGGTAPLQSMLTGLVSGLGAECGTIVRSRAGDPGPVRLALCDLSRAAPSCHLRRSFGDSHFGPLLSRARPATIWQATAHDGEASGDAALADWQSARGMKEFLVLVLSSQPQARDHIELHFRHTLTSDLKQTITALLPDMARTWTQRRSAPGSTQRKADPDRFRSRPEPRILDADNPRRLSRAEFRVCLSLSNGQVIPAVSQDLGLSEPTIRTHLRNIYAKIGCNSLPDLIERLMDHQPEPQGLYGRTA